jgi:Core-2/I-Branching enzyme
MSDAIRRPGMKLLFLILAHDRPDHAAELARTLVAAASDAVALIHFDIRGAKADFAALAAAVAGEPRIRLVEKRVAGAWGSFGLVEAPLNALAQAEAEGLEPDYVVLLSGSCLPLKPVASLERYLAENAGLQFIESEDEGWITGGWRSERWRYRHWFDHKTQRPLEWLSCHVQRLLRIRRRFPAGLEPRFGSQWWALTWPVVQAILADIRRSPKRLDFFRTVWIPDEMVFQTYVHALVHRGAIAGFGVTHFQFTNRGKPVVFHDDHADYLQSIERFFFRKASPEAKRLRARYLAIAAAPDDGAPLDRIGTRRDDYRLKIAAQTHYPAPGHVFYRDQLADMTGPVLARAENPYVVLLGPPDLTRPLAARLPQPPFTALGEVFDPDAVDLGPGRDALGGLRRSDVAIRDMHPALYLARLRARSAGVPVVTWSPVTQGGLLAEVMRDPRALVVAFPPSSGDVARDRTELILRCLDRRALDTPAANLPGVSRDRLRSAAIDLAAELQTQGPDMALWLVSGIAPAGAAGLRAPDLVLPWGRHPGARSGPVQRRTAFRAAAESCRFCDAPWFPALVRALEQAPEPEADRRPSPAAPALAEATP